MEERTLSEKDLEAIEERFAKHSCRMDLTYEDVVFIKKLNSSTQSAASFIFRGFLALVFIGFLFLAAMGLASKVMK